MFKLDKKTSMLKKFTDLINDLGHNTQPGDYWYCLFLITQKDCSSQGCCLPYRDDD